MQNIRFTRSARKHRIGKAHALHAMASAVPTLIPGTGGLDDTLLYIGTDDRGLELEIVAVVKPDCLLVIHVMPTNFR